MTKEKERMDFELKHQANQKRVELLSRELDSKDLEINDMKNTL